MGPIAVILGFISLVFALMWVGGESPRTKQDPEPDPEKEGEIL